MILEVQKVYCLKWGIMICLKDEREWESKVIALSVQVLFNQACFTKQKLLFLHFKMVEFGKVFIRLLCMIKCYNAF